MRITKIVNQLKKALKQEYLYNEEELSYMKAQLTLMEQKINELKHQDYKGFGKK